MTRAVKRYNQQPLCLKGKFFKGARSEGGEELLTNCKNIFEMIGLKLFFKWAIPGLFFFIFVFSIHS